MTERELKYTAFVKDDIENNKGRLVNCCDEIDYILGHPECTEIFQKHYLKKK